MQIVWRNPAPPSMTKPQIEQLVADDYGAVYAVRVDGESKAFELLLCQQSEEAPDSTLRIRCCEFDRLTTFEEQFQ
jgi:hypothetical protein